MAALPYATKRDRSRSRDVTRGTPAQALVATAWGVLVAVVLVGVGVAGYWHPAFGSVAESRYVAAGVATLSVVALVCGWRFRARVGGVTGDFLGATQQMGELAWLTLWAWLLGMGL
jgi:adenosylcobinamide-GDP ribazoletransferase